MKKTLIAATLLAATASTLVLAQIAPTSDEEDIRQIHGRLIKAGKQKDMATLNRYISEDALQVYGNVMMTKAEVFKEFAQPFPKDMVDQVKNRRVISLKVKGSNAVLVERIWQYSKEEEVNRTFMLTNVFAKKDSNWQLVVSVIPEN